MRSFASIVPTVVLAGCLAPVPALAQALAPRALYQRALERERAVRDAGERAALADLRASVRAYELVVLRFPRSGYCDDALWHAGHLAATAYERFRQERDRQTAERLFRWLRSEYPSSRFAASVGERLARLSRATAGRSMPERTAPGPRPGSEPPAAAPAAAPAAPRGPSPPTPSVGASPSAPRAGPATLVQLTRQPLPSGVRVVVELDAEVGFEEGRLTAPPRVFFDLRGVQVSPSLDRTPLAVADEVIRSIRLGQHPDQVTRIAVELAVEPRYSVFALYDPFRLVIDFEGGRGAPASEAAPVAASPAPSPPMASGAIPASPAPPVLPAPAAPARNSDGTFSLARQLGLGVSRIVVDPGHGGHDPGARAGTLTEAAIALDVALRLERLLAKEPGLEVVLTRREDVFVPLEERTAMANREAADLFLSIHVNASRSRAAQGVETYYLNFATDREAEAVAARENSASGRGMRSLPEMVQAIALNNKLNESRDLARLVQQSMIKTLRAQHRTVRNLGVKQAPFVVLIGAQMPSVLAEIAFITNKAEAALLAKPAYRQRVAQALFDAVVGYQQALKRSVARPTTY